MKATTKLVETARKLVVHISDDPEHAKLVETARKLREQEKEDEDVTKKYQEIYDKSNDPKEEDREVAMMYQIWCDVKHGGHVLDMNELRNLRFAAATEVEIASVTAN